MPMSATRLVLSKLGFVSQGVGEPPPDGHQTTGPDQHDPNPDRPTDDPDGQIIKRRRYDDGEARDQECASRGTQRTTDDPEARRRTAEIGRDADGPPRRARPRQGPIDEAEKRGVDCLASQGHNPNGEHRQEGDVEGLGFLVGELPGKEEVRVAMTIGVDGVGDEDAGPIIASIGLGHGCFRFEGSRLATQLSGPGYHRFAHQYKLRLGSAAAPDQARIGCLEAGAPRRSPAELKSSSTSGQWRP